MSERINPETHRLTNLPGIKSPDHCQRCSERFTWDALEMYIEHDHNDAPEMRALILCKPCAQQTVGPHPRLYKAVGINYPFPGKMQICIGCTKLVEGFCKSPLAKANGGPGVHITIEQPTRGFWDGRDSKTGRRTGGALEMWLKQASACAERS